MTFPYVTHYNFVESNVNFSSFSSPQIATLYNILELFETGSSKLRMNGRHIWAVPKWAKLN